jgi:hypothetical protein
VGGSAHPNRLIFRAGKTTMPRRRGKTSSRLRGKFHRLDASAAICEMSVNANYMNPKITYIERASKFSDQLTLPDLSNSNTEARSRVEE